MPLLKVTHPDGTKVEYDFGEMPVTIGSGEDNLVVLDDSRVSIHHAVIQVVDAKWTLLDLASENGTIHKGRRIRRLRLKPGAHFEIAGLQFRFRLEETSREADAVHNPASSSNNPGTSPSAKKAKRPRKHDLPKTFPAGAMPAKICVPNQERKAEITSVQARETSPEPGQPAPLQSRPASLPPSRNDSRVDVPPILTPARQNNAHRPRLLMKTSVALAVLAALLTALYNYGGFRKLGAWGTGMLPVQTGEPPVSHAKAGFREPADTPHQTRPPTTETAAIRPDKNNEIPIKPTHPEKPGTPLLPAKPQKMLGPAAASTSVGTTWETPEERLLFRPDGMDAGFQPVISPHLDHALHVKKAAEARAPFLMDVCLDGRVVATRVRIVTESDLRFSETGDSWAALGIEEDTGDSVLFLTDRKLRLRGRTRAWTGNRDFSMIATITSFEGEDHLHLNGKWKSSYPHIRSLRLSDSGEKWAYVAVKSPDSRRSARPAGERVVTETASLQICDEVISMEMSPDGARVAWVGRFADHSQALFVNSRKVHELAPTGKADIREIVFSPDGKRLAWVVAYEGGGCDFWLEGSASVRVDTAESTSDKASLLQRNSVQTRILFSQNGHGAAFAAAGARTVVVRPNGERQRHASVLMDSITFCGRTGDLIYVTLDPAGPVIDQSLQMHWMSLFRGKAEWMTLPVWVRKSKHGAALLSNIQGLRCSPDGQRIACAVNFFDEDSRSVSRHVVVSDGKNHQTLLDDVEDCIWLNAQELACLVADGDGSLRRLVVKP